MPPIKLERIISVSSEDPNHCVENLLKNDYSDKKWKSKNVGEKQISSVIQFEKPSIISSVDVGNFGSALIEILVGKSSDPDDFKVLLVASTLMTLQESKLGQNLTGVRFFKDDELSKPVAVEKWDRVKLICSQPYNKYIQYGLSFIIFRTTGSSQSAFPKPQAIGKFQLKDNIDTNQIVPGSLFARRKEFENNEVTGAAAIRAASVSAMANTSLPSECKLKEVKIECLRSY